MPERLHLKTCQSLLPGGFRKPYRSGASIVVGAILILGSAPAPVSVRAATEDQLAGLRALSLPSPDKEALRDAAAWMEKAGFTGEALARFVEMARDLASAGISTSDLASKVREGVVKKVGHERVMTVLDERVSRLKEARVLVLELAAEGVVFIDQQMAYQVVADYLSRGVGSRILREMVLQRSLADFPGLDNVLR
jgi:hypothetical protein